MNTESKSEIESELPTQTVLPMVIDPMQVKNVALVIIATIAVIFALNWAQSFAITLLLGVLLSYTLNPMVKWLELIKIPRVIDRKSVV